MTMMMMMTTMMNRTKSKLENRSFSEDISISAPVEVVVFNVCLFFLTTWSAFATVAQWLTRDFARTGVGFDMVCQNGAKI